MLNIPKENCKILVNGDEIDDGDTVINSCAPNLIMIDSDPMSRTMWSCSSALHPEDSEPQAGISRRRSEEMIVFSGTEGRLTTSTFGQEPVRLETGNDVQLFDIPWKNQIAELVIRN